MQDHSVPHALAADWLRLPTACCVFPLQRVEVRLVNYKKDGTPFLNRLRVTPLTTSLGQYTHMLGILEEIPLQGRNAAGQAQRGLARGANAAEQAQREQQLELAAQA